MIRFGAFEVDLKSAELRKHGVRLPLQEQPFRVLQTLLERPGEIVPREELIHRLWPDGTHVDFDRGLNAAVTRLRQALSDSAENPKYIETVPKQGYRFVGRLEPDVVLPVVDEGAPAASRRFRLPKWAAALLGVAAVITGLPLVRQPNRAISGRRPPVPLTSFSGYEARGSLSPDGRWVTFDWTREPGDTRVYIKLVGTGDPVRVTSGNAIELNPVWSPDGKFIAFLRAEAPGRIGVYVTPALGGTERKLTERAVSWQIAVGGDGVQQHPDVDA